MGLLSTDIVPISSTGPTPLIPAAKDILVKVFQVSRTDTVSSLKCVLPADASIIGIDHLRNVNSNAVTTAATTINVSNNTGVISTGSYNEQTGGDTTGDVQMTALPNLQPVPLTGDLQITAVYAETGGASSAGGPWKYVVKYVR